LNTTYKTAVQDQKHADSIRQEQKQWIKERNGCSNAACVKRAYETRLSTLSVTHTSSDGDVTSKQDAKDNSQNDQQYHFQLTKGAGTPVPEHPVDARLLCFSALHYHWLFMQQANSFPKPTLK
jgi:uncharacterized protein